ncbi:MAG: DUF349 domain-containing protein [Flavobacteriaceae bacterium]|nr:DUF349 domain-containing protein [Flavobacteriaceae bacterium]
MDNKLHQREVEQSATDSIAFGVDSSNPEHEETSSKISDQNLRFDKPDDSLSKEDVSSSEIKNADKELSGSGQAPITNDRLETEVLKNPSLEFKELLSNDSTTSQKNISSDKNTEALPSLDKAIDSELTEDKSSSADSVVDHDHQNNSEEEQLNSSNLNPEENRENINSKDVAISNSSVKTSGVHKKPKKSIDLPKPEIDLESLSIEELIVQFDSLIKDSDWNKNKNSIAEVKKIFEAKYHEDVESRKNKFLDQGGNQIDFFYRPDYKKQFDQLYREYRKKKREYYQDLEKELQSNLVQKEEILDQIKLLRNQDLSIKKKYEEIGRIKESWHKIGHVPRSKSEQLWRDYNHNLDLFYQLMDLHKLQKEETDKEEYDKIIGLLAEAKNRIDSLSFSKAKVELETFKNLLRVKSIRLSNRLKDDVWNRFRAIRKELDKKISEAYLSNLEIKKEAIDRLQAIFEDLPGSHEQWHKCAEELRELDKKFRAANPVSYKSGKFLSAKFYHLYWDITRKKNAFFKDVFKQRKEILIAKNQIIDEIKKIIDADDWKNHINRVKELRPEWKKLGFTSKKEERKLWNEFNELTQLFFDRHRLGYEKLTPHQETIVKAKERFVSDFSNSFELNDQDIWDQLNPHFELWSGFGSIHPDIDHKLNTSFHKEINEKLKLHKGSKKDRASISFECLIEIIRNDFLSIEKNLVQFKSDIASLEKEITQLENNLQFFDTSSSDNPLVREVEQKSSKVRDRLELTKQRYFKLKSLRTELSKNR